MWWNGRGRCPVKKRYTGGERSPKEVFLAQAALGTQQVSPRRRQRQSKTNSAPDHGQARHHSCRTSYGEFGQGLPGSGPISPRPLPAVLPWLGLGYARVHEGCGRPGVNLPKRPHHCQSGTWWAERGAQIGRHNHSDCSAPDSNAGTCRRSGAIIRARVRLRKEVNQARVTKETGEEIGGPIPGDGPRLKGTKGQLFAHIRARSGVSLETHQRQKSSEGPGQPHSLAGPRHLLRARC